MQFQECIQRSLPLGDLRRKAPKIYRGSPLVTRPNDPGTATVHKEQNKINSVVNIAKHCSCAMKRVPFVPPVWAQNLKFKPQTVYENLAMRPTPMYSWALPGCPDGFQLSIKRDDMTGSVLFGNKIRKLEFILADAMQRGCTNLITMGDTHSNHCRATAGAGALLGLKTHLFLLSKDFENPPDAIGEPNLLLDRLFGAEIHLIPENLSIHKEVMSAMEALASRLAERGEKSALIPVGGSNAIGVFGSMMAFEEMRKQGLEEAADDLVVAVGSGGNASGLAIANYLCKSPLKVHAISVCEDKHYFLGHCQEMLNELGIEAKAEEILNIIDGYKVPGYAQTPPEVIQLIEEVARSTGIVLDPVYTGKAAFGMREEMKKRPEQFKGRRVVFMHTGGALTKAVVQDFESNVAGFQMDTWRG